MWEYDNMSLALKISGWGEEASFQSFTVCLIFPEGLEAEGPDSDPAHLPHLPSDEPPVWGNILRIPGLALCLLIHV